MYCSGGEKDKILYNKPLNTGANSKRGQTIPCGGNQQVYPAIPLTSERRTENGRQVIYFRFTSSNPEDKDGEECGKPSCAKDGEECTNENCECPDSESKDNEDCAKPSCTNKDGTECTNEDCDCSNSKEDVTKEDADEEKKSWWSCGKEGCPCENMMTDPTEGGEQELGGDCKFCTVPGKNGEKIRIPCHHCFTDNDENGECRNNGNMMNCGGGGGPQCGSGRKKQNGCNENGHGRKLTQYTAMNRICCGTYSGGWNKKSSARDAAEKDGC